jgi:peptide/nickel transport system ATP-binding protein
VGESGSGKSTLARALMGYCRPGGVITAGDIRLDGEDIRRMAATRMRALRGGKVAFVPQNPLSRSRRTCAWAARSPRPCASTAAATGARRRAAVLELFEATRLPDPESLWERYPHELSGGQRQRVVIAAALAGNPRLMILDEPTTALDKTTEIQVLELVKMLRSRFRTALVYVSHDLNVVSEMCDRVLVMLDGAVVEQGATAQVYRKPAQDYTRRLVAAVPRIDRGPEHSRPRVGRRPALLSVSGLGFRYAARGWLEARPGAPRCPTSRSTSRRGENRSASVGESRQRQEHGRGDRGGAAGAGNRHVRVRRARCCRASLVSAPRKIVAASRSSSRTRSPR